jgi:protein-L-isoaspartate O-methyltransferase
VRGALNLEPGTRVLEIGTGTGWNAAVMAATGAADELFGRVLESQPPMPDRASAMVIARSRMSTARSMSSFSITSEGMSWNRL